MNSSLPAPRIACLFALLALADTADEEAQPKVAQRADGGSYVSWFHSDPGGSPAFGFDVRLQRLDADGNELWPHGGVLIADRGFSSTQDYSLAVDGGGNALLAFRDDRFTGTQITATRVDASGAQTWGPTGVQLTSTTAFVAAPKIAATTDGAAVVAWTQNSETRVQRLDGATGAPLWPADVVLTPADGGNYGASDLHGADQGTVILALQKSGGFTAPRHLHAQKLDPSGAPLWGANPLVIFDSGSLQFGNFPTFVPDGAGGAVFGWYSSSPSLECFAQRVTANGAEVFPHNGVAASTNGALERTSPWVGFDPVSQATFLVYPEENLSLSGVSAQKLDAAGNRLWSNTGATLAGPDSEDHTGAAGVVREGELTAFWVASPGFGQDRIEGARTDAGGAVVGALIDVSTTPAQKFRVQASLAQGGDAVVVWQDGGASGDVQIQNVNPNGTLGLPLTIDTATLSLASGGTASYGLNAGAEQGSAIYLMLGSASGTAPGLDVDGVNVPLNPDAYFSFSLLGAASSSLYVGFLGTLSPDGFANASFVLPPGANPALAGTDVHHAYVALESLQVAFASNAVAFELVP